MIQPGVWMRGHINKVMYPSGFNAICRVHCTEAEMCGVDSPLDKRAIGVRIGPNMATVLYCILFQSYIYCNLLQVNCPI